MYEMGDAEIKALARVVKSRQTFRYRGGEGGECDKFERALCEKLKCKHSLLVSQGTGALICALAGLDIGPGDEVIVPAYTFMATPLAAVALGAVPVIAEVDESLAIDPKDVEKKITSRTKVIMPVHMNGHPSDMAPLKNIAKKHSLKIVEDACQAVGGSYRGRRVGTIGDVGAFSFNHFKIISCGEGGAVVTSNKLIYHKALMHSDGGCAFRGHDMSLDIFCGWGFRVSEFQGAIMRVQLRRLDRILRNLRARKNAIYDALDGSPAYRMNRVNCREGDCGIATYILFENEAEMRKAQKALDAAGIGAGPPIDTGTHVYSAWEPILDQKGAGHPKRDAFKIAGKRYQYTKTMCPRSTELLSSTLSIYTNYSATVAENRETAKKMRTVIEAAPTVSQRGSSETGFRQQVLI